MVVMTVTMSTAKGMLVRHGAPVEDGVAMTVRSHHHTFTKHRGATHTAVVSEVAATGAMTVVVVFAGLGGGRSHHSEAGGNGEKGEEFFHLGVLVWIFSAATKAATPSPTKAQRRVFGGQGFLMPG